MRILLLHRKFSFLDQIFHFKYYKLFDKTVFDTTACNTEVENGATTLPEECKSNKNTSINYHHVLKIGTLYFGILNYVLKFWNSLFEKEIKADVNIDFKDFQKE